MHRYLLHNGNLCEASEPRLMSPGQVGLLNGWGVFSTLRVAQGVLFAYERHFARMTRDAKLMRVPFFTEPRKLQSMLLSLVEANAAQESTLRVAVVRNKGGMWEAPGIEQPFDVVVFTTELREWGSSARLGVVPQARHSGNPFSGTKILSWAANLNWYEQAHEQGFDEVVLLNEHDEVSECTSANLFASYGNEVVTPPLRSGCLPGITRELLVDGTVAAKGISVREQDVRMSDLQEADEVFLTSSTRELLTVSHIEGITVRTSGTARAILHEAFRAYMKRYVDQHSKTAAPGTLAVR